MLLGFGVRRLIVIHHTRRLWGFMTSITVSIESGMFSGVAWRTGALVPTECSQDELAMHSYTSIPASHRFSSQPTRNDVGRSGRIVTYDLHDRLISRNIFWERVRNSIGAGAHLVIFFPYSHYYSIPFTGLLPWPVAFWCWVELSLRRSCFSLVLRLRFCTFFIRHRLLMSCAPFYVICISLFNEVERGHFDLRYHASIKRRNTGNIHH